MNQQTTSTIYNTPDSFPFGMLMPNRSENSSQYRFGFNDMEKDDEVKGQGAQYDYGFRIYDPRIAKFLSVDPLFKSYPWYTPYQFAGNMPIWAIDLDGLEEQIVVYQEDKDGTVTSIKKITYLNVEDYGPLGNGVYTVHMKADGTFTEVFVPGEGNSIPSFSESNIKQARWVGDGNYKGFEDRLNARLIEKIVENSLIKEGHIASQVRNDVEILESDNSAFKAKFASFKEGTADNYIKEWDPASPSDPHFSEESATSNEVGESDVILKYYDGAKSSIIPSQIGLVRKGLIDHGVEYLRTNTITGDPSVNISVENAKRIKTDQEKTP